ncbi:Peptidyl-tRNA hydrolase [Cucumispora dikerogammari]|nr:Peptidyl-tRNA hydrolase [Cucumispora dikerogammari]
MYHIITLYIIIAVLTYYYILKPIIKSLFPLFFNNDNNIANLNRLPFKIDILNEYVPELVMYYMKHESNNLRQYILYINYTSLPINLREFSFLILVNNSLGMKGGKIISQISHGLFAMFYNSSINNIKKNQIIPLWIKTGQAKIILKCTESEILQRVDMAIECNIPCDVVRDAGRTQVKSGSLTVAFIGPWFVFVNKKISKGLKLM